MIAFSSGKGNSEYGQGTMMPIILLGVCKLKLV